MRIQRLTEDVVRRCGELGDFSPLIDVMMIVLEEIKRHGARSDDPKARKAWLQIMEHMQGEWSESDHNPRLPCRTCPQAFRPVIDDTLLDAFLAWHASKSTDTFIRIHRCPACGGEIKALDHCTYDGDFHTPEPGTIGSDDDWVEQMLLGAGDDNEADDEEYDDED